jgi:hypothetical protein
MGFLIDSIPSVVTPGTQPGLLPFAAVNVAVYSRENDLNLQGIRANAG